METQSEASPGPNSPRNGNLLIEKSKNDPHPPVRRRTILQGIQALGSKCMSVWPSFKHYWSERKRTQEPPEKQPPSNLSLWRLSLLLTLEIFILITITVLWILSVKRNGFVDVPDTPNSFLGNRTFHERLLWAKSFLWTFVPAFIVSTCGKLFAGTLQSLEKCQSTIELRLPRNSTAKRSILLDYSSYSWPFQDSYHALRNKHFLICLGTIIKWLFTAIGPLAAAVIAVGSVPVLKSVQVTTSTFFDDWRNESSTRPAFEIASAVLLDNGNPHAWSTKMYSVVPFTTNIATTGNIMAETGAYSATLDCVPIDVDSLLAVKNITQGSYGDTDFTFGDRGCTAKPYIEVTPNLPLYSEVSYVQCPFAAGQARLVLMTGTYDPDSPFQLGNFSLISCIPQFWNSTSRVTVISGSNGQIVDIIPDSAVQSWWPEFASLWMWRMPDYKIHDAVQSLDSDNFGLIAYNLATKMNGRSDFVQAMNVTFSAVFATFATLSTYSDLSTNLTLPATLSQPGNRLFVVSLQATIVTVVMALTFLVTLWLVIFAYQHKDILKEHSDLILGDAILLEGNEGVGSFIKKTRDAFREQVETAHEARARKKGEKASSKEEIELAMKNGDLVKYAGKNRSLNEWSCGVDGDGKLWINEPVPTSKST